MKLDTNEVIQWIGAVFIIGGHSLNAMGPSFYPWNIVVFFVGTIAFLTWTIRVNNRPQLLVNVIALGLGLMGLYKAFC